MLFLYFIRFHFLSYYIYFYLLYLVVYRKYSTVHVVQQYQKYFSKLPFNGKMYPTGQLRIYTEPFYEEQPSANVDSLDVGVLYKNGVVSILSRGEIKLISDLSIKPRSLD